MARKAEGSLDEWVDGPYIHASLGPRSRLPKATCSDPVRDGIAWHLWEACLSLFTALRPLIIDGTPNIDAASINHWKDLLGTFFVWGDGFRNGQLDLALRDSDDLKTSVISDLAAVASILKTRIYRLVRFARNEELADALLEIQELDEILLKAGSIYEDGSTNFEEHQSADPTLSPPLTLITDQSTEDTGNVGSLGETGVEELSHIAKDLGNHIFSLMGLVPSMENVLAGIKNTTAVPSVARVDFAVSEPAWPYVSNVRDKFPNADRKLIDRLGQANWERHTKVTERLDDYADVYSKTPQGIDVAKSIFAPTSLFHDSGLGGSSYTTNSYKSSCRSSSSASHPAVGRLRVSPTPAEVHRGIPFMCNICGHVLHKINSRNDWKIHVFADLHPYMCTFSSCRDEFVTFPTRGSWADHEFSYHRIDRYWNCPQCLEELSSTKSWSDHLVHEHGITYSGPAYEDAIETAENTIPRPYETQQCPLCLVVPGHSQKSFINHVGQHMEDIALAALPRKPASTSEIDSMSSTHSPNAEPRSLKYVENEVVHSQTSTPSPKVAHSRLRYHKAFEEPENRVLLPQDQRAEQCPLENCAKKFDRKFDRNRHVLTHFKGTLMCRFCPQSGSAGLRQFTRVENIKKHLIERHGAGVGRNPSQQRRYKGKVTIASVICAVCHIKFNDAQTLYRHLDDCILRLIERRYAGQSSRKNIFSLRSVPKIVAQGGVEDYDARASSSISLRPSSRKYLGGTSIWSHEIPVGLDGLYHCPWESQIHCSHQPASLRHELHHYIDEHRKPYRCTNRLCGDVRFSSKAGLQRHECDAPHLHTEGYEYKMYNCPVPSCVDALNGRIFMKTSDLREHIAQKHPDDRSNCNPPYWSDSSSSTQSPPLMSTLDKSFDNSSWDEWFDNLLKQAESQPASGGEYNHLDFPTASNAQEPGNNIAIANENLSSTQPISSLTSLGFEFEDLDIFNANTSKPSALDFSHVPSHGFITDTIVEDRVIDTSNLNYSMSPEKVKFVSGLPTQGSIPTSSTAVNPGFNRASDLLKEGNVTGAQYSEAGLISTAPIYAFESDPSAITISDDLWAISTSRRPLTERPRSYGLPQHDFSSIDSLSGIQRHPKSPRGTKRKPRIPNSLAPRETFPREQGISMAGDVYGVSDPESNVPEKKRRSASQALGTGLTNQPLQENLFELESTQEIPGERSSQINSREALIFRCRTCRRTYKTETALSYHLQHHRHKYSCTYPGCSLTFDPIKDFNRHIGTHIPEQEREKFFCEVEGCKYELKGFSRKDNLAKHIRAYHQNEDCHDLM